MVFLFSLDADKAAFWKLIEYSPTANIIIAGKQWKKIQKPRPRRRAKDLSLKFLKPVAVCFVVVPRSRR